ncbi:flagellar hook assembly protein FlgD [Sphingomonas morindae]|uniref:Basal-body rod modification protein FlgD n=1 Tax=Sphingomonas morindae TaxID=1541170 RepID=A0ABY4X9U2_9SPHN|nr:flagellar hook capping FlgD N-terminal domain-containing protein [Sphingomonas morindae]USI73737.1 flagellar hook capping protein [Sphingomonas morindae]
MTSVTSSIDSLKTPTTSPTSTGAGSQTIDQAGFLKLLTTQMTSQDPTAPMDTNTMVTQLSQLSQTSGITEMNASLKSLVSEATGNRIGDAASWIGKAALVSGSVAQPMTDGSFGGQITLPADATSVNVDLVDAGGNVVHSEQAGAQPKGSFEFLWDGKGADGKAVSGPLSVKVSAVGSAGAVTPTVATWSTVTGVNSPAGGSAAQLTTTVGTVAPSDVLSLS